MTAKHVFMIGSSWEKDRPVIDFQLPENSRCVDWGHVRKILDGTLEASEYTPPRLVVRAPNATKWDFYLSAGTLGVISKRAVDVIGSYGTRCLEFLDAYINDHPYHLIRKIGVIDCLDRKNTRGSFFPHDPSEYMEIEQYGFHKSKHNDPCLFVIPEGNSSCLFGTDSIKQLIEEHQFRGFRIVDAEHESLWGT